jgi:peptide methionine sulfoxide reductase msrA/msrB
MSPELPPLHRDRWLGLPRWLLVALLLLGAITLSYAQPTAPKPQRSKVMSTRTYQKPAEAELRKKLSPLEYEVTQHDATEPPFRNKYWDNHEAGLYVDVTTGEPLFSSRDKFDSGTGWPSFSKALEPASVVEKQDKKYGMVRVEVRSKGGNAHLGHLFDDGPAPTGMRYCINSASLRFIPVDKLEAEGYGAYLPLFGGSAAPKASVEAGASARAQNSDASANPRALGFRDEKASANACVADPGRKGPAGCETTLETAILAGGCFWGMEDLLRKVDGVLETEVGYTGGSTKSPRYEDVKHGQSGHAESVRITFDPKKISYADLLEKWFFKMHDPTTKNRQGNDVGTQYRSAIFATTPEQKRVAQEVKQRVEAAGKWKRPLVTEIVDASTFTPAEDYHQDYLVKHPGGYTCHFMREF